MSKTRALAVAAGCLLATLAAPPLQAGFTGTDLVIAATARAAGREGSQFYSTLWVTNLSTGSSNRVTFSFLQQGQSNTAPLQKVETLTAGETRKYENVVSSLFGKDGVAGAIRIQAEREVLASSRTYDQPSGADLKDVKGLFFGAVPTSFAIGLGETAHLQGVTQGGSEDYRYNYGFVEVSGNGSTTVRVTLRQGNGTELATKDYPIRAFEAFQLNVSDLGAVATTNGRLEATVMSGAGRVLFYGTQIANGSQDSAGFEMSFKDGLLVANAQSSAEKTAAAGASSVLSTVGRASDIGPGLGLARRQPLANDYSADYNEQTGFWHVTFSLASGQSADVQVQFRDAQGQVQKIYNPLTTATILVKGSAAGPQGYATFDVTLSGGRGSSTFTANGSGTVTYQGSTGSLSINSVVIPKTQPFYPTSGTITCAVNGITVTITFNGTQYATATYQYRNQTFTFTIDLKTGEVTTP